MKLMLLLTLFVTSPLLCMELATSSPILSQPDIIKLIAYALVDTTQSDNLVDYPPYRNIRNVKQLLVAFQSFSATNKKIHTTIYNLRCGITQEAIDFNCYFYTRMGAHATTAAFMGTPWALKTILDTRFKELNGKYGKKTAMEELNKLLGARSESIPQRTSLNFTDMPPSYRSSMPSIITGYDCCYESIEKTMAKFPPSTRQFILKFIE